MSPGGGLIQHELRRSWYTTTPGLGGQDGAAASSSARRALEAMELWDHGGTVAYKLSGGQKRRAIIAAALASSVDVLFLDEPTVGLDPVARGDIWGRLRSLARSGATILLTTHYMEEAEAISDEVMFLFDGRIVAGGKPEQLKQEVQCGFKLEVRGGVDPPSTRARHTPTGTWCPPTMTAWRRPRSRLAEP